MSGKVAFCTLGCRVNQYETQAIQELFAEQGFDICEFNETADIYIINTCAVTVESERKSRQMIRRAKSKNKDAIIGVVGCSSQLQPRRCQEAGANIVLGTSDKTRIAELCIKALNTKNTERYVDISVQSKHDCDNYTLKHSKRPREFIKIEDGCNGKCSYCTIAKARGSVRSKSPEEALKEIVNLVNEGCKEVTLTGIELSAYEYGLFDLIRRVNCIKGLYGIRLGSLEPTMINDEFIQTYRECDKLLPHFHISLQSGCTETLNRMRRKYNAQTALDNILKLQRSDSRITLSCDLIVGFPGETDEEFNQTMEFLRRVKFLHIHAFPFSGRPGTEAYSMNNQISGEIKNERMKAIENLQKDIKCEILTKNVKFGKLTALVEKGKDGVYFAHSDNFIETEIKSDCDITSKAVIVKAVSHNGERISAEYSRI